MSLSTRRFIDVDFPPNQTTLGLEADVKWMHISEIRRNPTVCVAGCFDRPAVQGSLGNCGFVAAAYCLVANELYYSKVMPSKSNSDGSLTFTFYDKNEGRWVQTTIDCYLPTLGNEGASRSLVSTSHADPREFAAPLLEKAYIKFSKRTYKGLIGIHMAEVMEHFTGGTSTRYGLSSITKSSRLLLQAQEKGAMMCVGSIQKNHPLATEAERNNVCPQHAYSIVEIRQDNSIILRNPWGQGPNGRAPFCRELLVNLFNTPGSSYCQTDDGKFPVSFDELKQYFCEITICEFDDDIQTHIQNERRRSENPPSAQLTVSNNPWPLVFLIGIGVSVLLGMHLSSRRNRS